MMAPSENDFFVVLDRLLTEFPFETLEACDRIFSTDFTLENQGSANDVFKVYTAESVGDAFFSKAELRANFEKPRSGQLINLTLRKPQSLSKKQFEEHFKMSGISMGLASPHDVTRGTYVIFKLLEKSVQLRCSFTDLSETVLTNISLDSFEA